MEREYREKEKLKAEIKVLMLIILKAEKIKELWEVRNN